MRSVNDLLTKKWYLDGPGKPESTRVTLPSARRSIDSLAKKAGK